MPAPSAKHFLIVGAGAAGLMAARDLVRAGRQVTVLEARDRCGGRIWPLPVAEFGYPAEGGAEFVHGAAPVTRAVMREAGLALAPRGGTRWSTRGSSTGALAPDEAAALPYAGQFYEALHRVEADLPIAEFLEAHFADRRYDGLRRSITRTVEGYDAADPRRMSTLALREEWLARDDGEHGRVAQGYGALIDYLAADCRRYGGAIHLGAAVAAIQHAGGGGDGGVVARCRDGVTITADAAILAVPLPILSAISLPPAVHQWALAAVAGIGYGNVVKILLRFATKWWARGPRRPDLADLSFLIADAPVPTWWTQHPDDHPVLTGWYAGPKADRVAALGEGELIDMGIASLAEIFVLPPDRLRGEVVASRGINWGNDPYAGGAYSYATPQTRGLQAALNRPDGRVGSIIFTGEALYAGPDMGTVEAALASGRDTASEILAADG